MPSYTLSSELQRKKKRLDIGILRIGKMLKSYSRSAIPWIEKGDAIDSVIDLLAWVQEWLARRLQFALELIFLHFFLLMIN